VDFYNRPHAQINRFEYWELRVIWLMLRGQCFRVPLFHDGPLGERTLPRLKGVLILDPSRFQHIVEDNQLIGWRYINYSRNTPLSSQVFLPEEVWHEKLPNPFEFWRGMSPLAVASLIGICFFRPHVLGAARVKSKRAMARLLPLPPKAIQSLRKR